MAILDGNMLSQKILAELRRDLMALKKPPRLAVVIVGEDKVVEKFVAQKRRVAESVGIDVRLYRFSSSITTNELRRSLAEIVHERVNTGVIVQLPLPPHINTPYALNAITPEKDVDVLSARAVGNLVVGKSLVLPPVLAAIRAFFEEYNIDWRAAHIVILGAGNLVGRPAALWLLQEKATVSMVEETTKDREYFLKHADIIISGMGNPQSITGDMVKKGVVVLDAGTSESGGKVVGDVDFDSVSPKASFITPVPGGIGPVAVAMLLKNLVALAAKK